MLLLGVSSLAASLMDIKPYLHLQLVPHITKYHQVSSPFTVAARRQRDEPGDVMLMKRSFGAS